MTVEEIKAKLPESSVYSLSPENKYVLLFNRELVSMVTAKELLKELYKLGIDAIAVAVDDLNNSIRILETK